MITPRLLVAGICPPFLFSGVAKLLDIGGLMRMGDDRVRPRVRRLVELAST